MNCFFNYIKETRIIVIKLINLFFNIFQSPIPPQYISWKRNGYLLNYEQNRGGVSITTDHGQKTSSRLIIENANLKDSGNYTCGAPNTEPASVHVFVSQGKIKILLEGLIRA